MMQESTTRSHSSSSAIIFGIDSVFGIGVAQHLQKLGINVIGAVYHSGRISHSHISLLNQMQIAVFPFHLLSSYINEDINYVFVFGTGGSANYIISGSGYSNFVKSAIDLAIKSQSKLVICEPINHLSQSHYQDYQSYANSNDFYSLNFIAIQDAYGVGDTSDSLLILNQIFDRLGKNILILPGTDTDTVKPLYAFDTVPDIIRICFSRYPSRRPILLTSQTSIPLINIGFISKQILHLKHQTEVSISKQNKLETFNKSETAHYKIITPSSSMDLTRGLELVLDYLVTRNVATDASQLVSTTHTTTSPSISPQKSSSSPKTVKNPNHGHKTRRYKYIFLVVVLIFFLALVFAPIIGLLSSSVIARSLPTQHQTSQRIALLANISRYSYQSLITQLQLLSSVLPQEVVENSQYFIISTHYTNSLNLSRLQMTNHILNGLSYLTGVHVGDVYPEFLAARDQGVQVHRYASQLDSESIKTALSSESISSIQNTTSLLELWPQLVPAGKSKTIAVVVQDNFELRPSGGYIAAVGVYTVSNGNISSSKIYNIEELDAQLKGYVKPPLDAELVMGENQWFLRDGNWDTNFNESSQQIAWFLHKQLGVQPDIIVAINHNLLKDLLNNIGSLELENSTIVTPDNYDTLFLTNNNPNIANSNILLGDIFNSLFLSFKTSSPAVQLMQLQTLLSSLNTHQTLISIPHNPLQSTIDSIGWGGELTQPQCPPSMSNQNCSIDVFYYHETNVGINKANAFLSRHHQHHVSFEPDQAVVTHSVLLSNNAPTDSWPAGTYKNYVRFRLSPNVYFKQVKIDNKPLPESDIITASVSGSIQYGFVHSVPIQSSRKIDIIYYLPIDSHSTDSVTFSFLMNKQPGTSNDPLDVSYITEPNWQLVSSNHPIVNDSFGYNHLLKLDTHTVSAVELEKLL